MKIPFATTAAATQAALSATPSDEVLAIGERYTAISSDHGYRLVRHRDGGVARFYGDDSSEDFLARYGGEEVPDGDESRTLEDGIHADSAGEWAERESEFDILSEEVRIERKSRMAWEPPETAQAGVAVIVRGTRPDGTPFAAYGSPATTGGPTTRPFWTEACGRPISGPGVTVTGWHPCSTILADA